MNHKHCLLVFLLLMPLTVWAQDAKPRHNLMPIPASLQFKEGRLAITEQFTVAVRGHNDARLQAGIERMARRLDARTGLTFKRGLAQDAAQATLLITCQNAGKSIPAVDEDESYALEVNNGQALLNAPTVVGVLRGL